MSGNADRDRAVDEALRRSRAGQSRATVEAPSDACLDPETLALWVDDGLSATERATAERHVADCARCQATLAALVRTAPVPDTHSRPSAATAMRPWWQTLRAAWLAPVAAAAAALAIWIAVPGAPPPRSAEQSTPVSAPVASPPQPAKQEAQNAPANTAEPPAVERRDKKALVEKPLPASPPPEQTRARASEVAATPPPAAAPAPAANPTAATRAFSEVAAADALSKSARQANAIAPEIVSPEPMSRWRITAGRIVEHSTDGGATWQEQPTGATSSLTAGSAPSASICWVVGQDGVVLLSTDGRTWRRVGSPATTALVSVRAADERTATVTDVNGRTYATTDGGVRWTQGQ